jgi:5'-nucleotidase (lipoprotein e(P4) family)
MPVFRRIIPIAAVLSLTALACGAADASADSNASESSVTQGPAAPAPSGEPAAAPPMSKEIHWFRSSAEYRAITRQTYALAARALDAKVQGRDKGAAWAVVLDCDETVLDNSEHQKENQGKPFSQDAWTAWVNRKEAKAIPGAVAFTKHVRDLGGKVVIVTNRMDGTECPATETNLKAVNVTYDAILCKKDTSDKNPRFQAVAAGTAIGSLPALEILAFVGDNIQDFPAQTQELAGKDDAAFADFGSKFFTLPNPMYGSWEKNPQN